MIGPQGIPGPVGIPGPQGAQIGPTFYVTGVVSQTPYLNEGARYPAEEFTIVSPVIDGLHIQPDFFISPTANYTGGPVISYTDSLIELPVSDSNRYKFTATLDHVDIVGAPAFSAVPYIGIYAYILDEADITERVLLNRSLYVQQQQHSLLSFILPYLPLLRLPKWNVY